MLLFAVDCRPAMLAGGKDSPALEAFQAILAIYKSKAVANMNDRVGVVLFGTAVANNASGFDSIHVLLDLDEPSVESVKTLSRIVSGLLISFISSWLTGSCIGDIDIAEEYGSTDAPFPLANVLWICSGLLVDGCVT